MRARVRVRECECRCEREREGQLSFVRVVYVCSKIRVDRHRQTESHTQTHTLHA
jgi:hypothetical protein